uniref:Putative histidine kinase n=1 Tax=uncultured crenarchaeote TaxID=29281 RepID=Q8NKM3_9CREN|nr:putative histidine kinase [uncultured crenarchaeote]
MEGSSLIHNNNLHDIGTNNDNVCENKYIDANPGLSHKRGFGDVNNNENDNDGGVDAGAPTTKVYYGPENANNAILRFIDRANVKIDSCINSVAPSVMIGVDAIREKRVDAVKNRGLKLRYVTEITKDNVGYVKEMLSFSEIRHLDGLKGNFEVADQREYVAVATLHAAQSIPQLLFSNLPEIAEQQQFVFDSFWGRALPAEHRIKELEDGVVMPVSLVFSNYKDAVQREFEMISRAKREILIMYSTVNAFHLQEKGGTLQLLKEMVEQNDSLRINILTPMDASVRESLSLRLLTKYRPNIQVQDIAPSIGIKIKTLVVDRKESLVMELIHAREEVATAAIGFSIYSNSEPTVLSYSSIFEVLYDQSVLFQQLDQNDKVKSEFINVAAHELRTPIMPILNGVEILEEKLGERKTEFQRELDMITRNASRLQNLAESILQVSRIESGSFSLDIQKNVDIHNLISQVIEDIEKKYAYKEKANKVAIVFLPSDGNRNGGYSRGGGGAKAEGVKAAAGAKQAQKETQQKEQWVEPVNGPNHLLYVDCDPQKISQVVFNLLDNAMKFTNDGKIVVSTAVMGESSPFTSTSQESDTSNTATAGKGNGGRVDSSSDSDNGGGDNGGDHIGRQKEGAVLVTVQDTGVGLNSKIRDQLFQKFVTKSNQGTGLGLYLSRKIVEEHGGKIWFEETNSKGGNSSSRNNTKDKDEGIDEILHHLGSEGKIGATFKFVIPVSLPSHMPTKDMPEKNDEGK